MRMAYRMVEGHYVVKRISDPWNTEAHVLYGITAFVSCIVWHTHGYEYYSIRLAPLRFSSCMCDMQRTGFPATKIMAKRERLQA